MKEMRRDWKSMDKYKSQKIFWDEEVITFTTFR